MVPGPLGAYIWYYLQESKPASIRAPTPERHNLLLFGGAANLILSGIEGFWEFTFAIISRSLNLLLSKL